MEHEKSRSSSAATSQTWTSPSTDSEDSLSPFAYLISSIPLPALAALATRIRCQYSTEDGREKSYKCTVIQPPKCGSFNLVYVLEFTDGVKWIARIPATGKHGQFTQTSLRAIRSEALTMLFLRKNTSILIPQIYDFDETTDNELCAPYILMEFVTGFPVYEKWFDDTGPTPIEDRRLRILDTVAAAMAQLGHFQFNKIGSLQFVPNLSEPTVGQCIVVDEEAALMAFSEGTEAEVRYKKLGPFDSSQEYFMALASIHKSSQDNFAIGMTRLLKLMIECIPPSIDKKAANVLESFVLVHPDFDSQNILVSEDGTVTAFIDWDNVQTVPRCIGYNRYPAWITRDWDPMKYGYGKPNCQPENSPEELDYYRRHYAEKMKTLLPDNIDFTTKSHLFEAIWIAASSPVSADHIVEKIFLHLFPDDVDSDGEDDDDANTGDEATEDTGMRTLTLYESAVGLADDTLENDVRSRIADAYHRLFSIAV